MSHANKRLLGFITVGVLGILAAFLLYKYTPADLMVDLNTPRPGQSQNNPTPTPRPSATDKPAQNIPSFMLLANVPFFAQAPTANWSDPRQQDGCEEASLLMAHLWLTGETMTAQQAEQAIIAMSEYQKEKYGEFVDRSITDTGKLFAEYYKHTDYTVRRNITADDIKKEIASGNLVIVPTNGQIFDNPNYTGAGPITHMMPIIGYDDNEEEFITNDPGTRNGKQFRFTYDNLMDAIYDYETGEHVGYEKTETIMMVVKK